MFVIMFVQYIKYDNDMTSDLNYDTLHCIIGTFRYAKYLNDQSSQFSSDTLNCNSIYSGFGTASEYTCMVFLMWSLCEINM